MHEVMRCMLLSLFTTYLQHYRQDFVYVTLNGHAKLLHDNALR